MTMRCVTLPWFDQSTNQIKIYIFHFNYVVKTQNTYIMLQVYYYYNDILGNSVRRLVSYVKTEEFNYYIYLRDV